jgi:lipoprotein-anchoring transpeptidase ErfK/SrfK
MKTKNRMVLVNISAQRLSIIENDRTIKQYPVSTSKYGVGNRQGSNKTPLGLHRIKSKIGRNARLGEIFRAGRRTKKIAMLNQRGERQDLITTRILKLQGLEKGINQGKGIDSLKRCIYIHGTAQEYLIGRPASHGCIRMNNKDIIELFDFVPRGILVRIIK